MLVATKFLGDVEVKESEVFTFNHSLPGFPDLSSFVILPIEQDSPFLLLQSTEDVEIGFVLAYSFAFKSDYAFDLSEEDKEDLQIEAEEEIAIYSIITLNESMEKSTLNLLAPVVLNVNKKRGKQIILQDSSKYPLRQPLRELEGSVK